MREGSPPPMRGKGCLSECYQGQNRITPAYAGKSVLDFSSILMVTDHPRLCGEKSEPACTSRLSSGSPPPMRGKVLTLRSVAVCRRITPAYAGKRKKFLLWVYLYEDHPRLCGEKYRAADFVRIHQGSPPPMRGKAFDANGDVTAAGITPAYAGKSLPFPAC